MAKATIVGNAVVITSAAKLSDIEKIAKYRPSALVLKGGEDGKEELFRVKAGRNGQVNAFGVEFSSVSRDGEGLASVTIALDTDVADVRAYVADKLGTVITNLTKLEGKWSNVIEDIDSEINTVMESIEVL